MADDTPRFFFSSMPDLHSRADWKTYPRARCTTRCSLRQESQQEVVESCCSGNNDREGQFRTGVAGMTPLDVMWVGLGGGLGSLLRWSTGRVIGDHYRGAFPVGTFLINVSGSLVIGYLSVLFNVDWHNRYGHGMVLNALMITGVCWPRCQGPLLPVRRAETDAA